MLPSLAVLDCLVGDAADFLLSLPIAPPMVPLVSLDFRMRSSSEALCSLKPHPMSKVVSWMSLLEHAQQQQKQIVGPFYIEQFKKLLLLAEKLPRRRHFAKGSGAPKGDYRNDRMVLLIPAQSAFARKC